MIVLEYFWLPMNL